jgi:glutathione S-transferase
VAEQYQIFGALGSPYSMKMRAVLRYRRLPHVFIHTGPGDSRIAHVKPPVIPVIQFPDGSWHVDSTPMIDLLEQRHPDERSIVPDDDGDAFLAFLIEDFADEWMTKMMFHYRWYREVDQRAFSHWGVFDRLAGRGRAEIEKVAQAFAERQVGRMSLVGCTEQNKPLIEGTYTELIELLDAQVTEQEYLFGDRPSRADFGVYGQLTQLASDPTPAAIMRERAPYLYRWVVKLDDACGIEGGWSAAGDRQTDAINGLLRLCGEVYLPFLVANARAFEQGDKTFSVELRGCGYEQGTFKYQAKCLAELRRRFAELGGAARERVEAELEEAGALEALAA